MMKPTTKQKRRGELVRRNVIIIKAMDSKYGYEREGEQNIDSIISKWESNKALNTQELWHKVMNRERETNNRVRSVLKVYHLLNIALLMLPSPLTTEILEFRPTFFLLVASFLILQAFLMNIIRNPFPIISKTAGTTANMINLIQLWIW